MTIELPPDVAAALAAAATGTGQTPETMAETALRDRFVPLTFPFVPRDDWERKLLAIGRPIGANIPDSALTREEMYE